MTFSFRPKSPLTIQHPSNRLEAVAAGKPAVTVLLCLMPRGLSRNPNTVTVHFQITFGSNNSVSDTDWSL
jgi:hypothetical protein